MFKSAFLYLIKPGSFYSSDVLAEKLAESEFKGIGKIQHAAHGFVPPVDHSDGFIYELAGYQLIKLHTEKKNIKSSVIDAKLKLIFEEFEDQEGYCPGRKIRMQMKDDLIAEMLPSIHPEPSNVTAHIDIKRGWLVVHAGSDKAADEFTASLREALGSLAIVRVQIMPKFLSMVSTVAQSDFDLGAITLGDKAKFKDRSETNGPAVSVSNLSLYDEQIGEILSRGYEMTEALITYDDAITALVTDGGQMKSIKLSDEVVKGAFVESEDRAAQVDADFVLSCNHFTRLYEHIADYTKNQLTWEGLEGE